MLWTLRFLCILGKTLTGRACGGGGEQKICVGADKKTLIGFLAHQFVLPLILVAVVCFGAKSGPYVQYTSSVGSVGEEDFHRLKGCILR